MPIVSRANNVNKRILIVEDNPNLSESLKLYLEKNDYHVTVAETGKDALKSLRNTTHDLVLLDLLLPDMNGISVLRKIKDEQIDIRVVIVSNLTDDTLKSEIKQIGNYEYIQKASATLQSIAQQINKALEA